jgi:polar amino acid transport system substrate-binding protein
LLERLSKKVDLNEALSATTSSTDDDGLNIPDFANIDTKQGLEYLSGNKKIYVNILHNFLKKYSDFDLNSMNDEEFGRSTHTLKGLSASIGASKLHTLVRKLDETKDKTLLFGVEEELKNVLDELREKLLTEDKKESQESKKTLNKEDEKLLLENMREALDSMEPEQCEEVINKLNTYLLDDALKDTLAKINAYVEEYDFDEALKLIDDREAKN